MEKTVTFDCQGIPLEGLLHTADNRRAAIVTHPHPLYGGDMNAPVVAAIARVYQDRDWTTLRFNFRGTQGSQGNYDNGIGEQEDIDAAIAFLNASGARQIDLVGYSFGAWVLALWATRKTDHGHRIHLVAPPVAFIDFKDVGTIKGFKNAIVGSLDELAPVKRIETLLPFWHPKAALKVVQNADHFFWDHMDELKQAIFEVIQ